MKPVDENLDRRARVIASAIHGERGFAALANSVLAEQENSDAYYAALAALEHGDFAHASYFQARVRDWMIACFPAIACTDLIERGDRLLEEIFELLQSGNYPRERIRALEAYVYGRPAGEQDQEAGGVMVTLAAYCAAFNINMHAAGECELARISMPEVMEKIRAKQATKPTGSALPIATDLDRLDPRTRKLVEDFSRALAAKLAAARDKYGYADQWAIDDWEIECRNELLAHVMKGDPLDVAAYAAFCWSREWTTMPDLPANISDIAHKRRFVLHEVSLETEESGRPVAESRDHLTTRVISHDDVNCDSQNFPKSHPHNPDEGE